MARPTLPVKPGVLYGLMKELRGTKGEDRPLVVTGASELARVVAKELGRGAKAGAVREGGSIQKPAAVVYVLAAPLTEADEAELKAADKQRTPIVALLADDRLDGDVPYVLATDVVRAHPGRALPVDELVQVLARRLGEDAAPLAARVPVLRQAVARSLVQRFSRRNGLIGAAVFIPGADMPILTLNQVRLVFRIAQIYEHELDQNRAVELLGVLGSGLGFRMIAHELLDFLPGPGWLIKGSVAYGGTRTIGQAAIVYFESLRA